MILIIDWQENVAYIGSNAAIGRENLLSRVDEIEVITTMLKRNISGHFIKHPSSWRRMAPAMWRTPMDPAMYGTLQIDATNALDYIGTQSETSGTHVTITHLITKAIADALAAHPECNVFVRLGGIFQRTNVDILVVVAMGTDLESAKGQQVDLTGITIRNADKKYLIEMAKEVQNRATKARAILTPSPKTSPSSTITSPR